MFTFEAHPRGLNTCCMTFIPGDKPLLATAGNEGVRVWNLTTREVIQHLDTNDEDPSALTCSPDGRLLVLCQGKYPTMIRLWDWAKNRVVKEIDGGYQVQCAIFSPDGKSLAIGGYRAGRPVIDYSVRRLRVASWQPQWLLRGHTDQTGFLTYSPDNTLLASAAADKRAILWDLKKREAVVSVKHQTVAWGVAFSGDGSLLASTGGKTIKLVDTVKRKELRGQLRGHSRDVRGIAFAPDGQTLVSVAQDGTVRWWDVGTRKSSRVLDWGLGPLHCIGFSSDGTLGAAGSAAGHIVVWDVDE